MHDKQSSLNLEQEGIILAYFSPLMKQFLIVITFLLITVYSNGQSAASMNFSNGICHCLDSLNKTTDVEHSFPICFSQALEKNASAVFQEMIQTYGDTTETTMNRFTDTLEVRSSIYLIGTCTIFYKYTDSLYNQQYKKLNKDSLQTVLKRLEEIDSTKRTKSYYLSLGIVYFQLRIYDKALESIEKVLSEDSTNIKSLFIKASINLRMQNYDEAIELFDQVAKLSHQNSFYIYSAMAKRKESGM
jgi:tetratricopeptide (TPR) repeat protein